MKKSDFNYHLPDVLIAQQPLSERTASRLLCMNRDSGELFDRKFNDLLDLIEPDDLLVFNDTRVIPARLFGTKETGGKIEILIERILNEHEALAHIRSSKSPKGGSKIELDNGYFCEMLCREDDLFHLKFANEKTLLAILSEIGHIPLPPYIERADNENDLTRYQTVFGKNLGAVAAPTAGLHFDEIMLEKIKAKGIETAFVTLHVGSGTFQPVRVENLSEHIMHKEFYNVPQETVNAVTAAKKRGGRVIAIGTTAVRALESASHFDRLEAGFGDTNLFILPRYEFKVVDALLTNFQLPESTLLMLVSAFSRYEFVMNAYRHAIEKEYRFFSYGDAMWISVGR